MITLPSIATNYYSLSILLRRNRCTKAIGAVTSAMIPATISRGDPTITIERTANVAVAE